MLLKLMADLQSLVKGKDESRKRIMMMKTVADLQRERGRESLAAPAVMSRERRVGEGFYRKQHSCRNMPQACVTINQ